MSTPPDDLSSLHSLALQLARVDVKLDNIGKTVDEHSKVLEALKARRWPLSVVTALGSAGAVYAMLRGHA